MFSYRKDLGVRGAGEKAQQPDEFLTRSQLVPGANITFDYLANWDIRISGAAGGAGGVAARQLTVDMYPVQRPAGGIGLPIDFANFRYASATYIDIAHNWNLEHKDAFLFTWVDLAIAPGVNATRHSCPKAIGLDTSTVRIWAAILSDYSPHYRVTFQEFIAGSA